MTRDKELITKIGNAVQEFTQNKMFSHNLQDETSLKQKIAEFSNSYVRTLSWR